MDSRFLSITIGRRSSLETATKGSKVGSDNSESCTLREGQVATVLASYRLSREPAPSPITAIADKARRIAGQDLLRDSDFPHIHSNPLVLYDRELQQWQRVEPCIPATRRWVTLKEWKQALTRRARDVGSTAGRQALQRTRPGAHLRDSDFFRWQRVVGSGEGDRLKKRCRSDE